MFLSTWAWSDTVIMARIQLTVTGGKGGTGKTFVAVNLAILIAKAHDLLLADLDLEVPNDHLILGINTLENKEDIKLFLPFINYRKCTICGVCTRICSSGALFMPPKSPPIVFPRLCSGCKACFYACPYNAIMEGGHVIAYSYLTHIEKYGVRFNLLTGMLRPGEEHVASALAIVKRRALKLARDVLLIDTGAGTGSSISIALQNSDLVIAVTEPTPPGLHDLEAILEVVHGMGYSVWIVINRYGIGKVDKHIDAMKKYGVDKCFKIPFSKDAIESYVKGVPVVFYKPDSPVSRSISEIYRALEEEIL